MKFNIYVPSYKRSGKIKTGNIFPYCTYVVRDSERDAYENAGVNVISAADDEINSIPKVENWIIENTPEDVVCMIDDDVNKFSYRLERTEKIATPEEVYDEIIRVAQIVVDLGIGYASTPSDMNPKFYSQEYKFAGITGPLRIVNKEKCRSRFNEIPFLNDIDFELQELLKNRIILIPNYFCVDAEVDVNAGGSNDSKSLREFYSANETMRNKWGRYYEVAKDGKQGKVSVRR